jgi:hypothetical protein
VRGGAPLLLRLLCLLCQLSVQYLPSGIAVEVQGVVAGAAGPAQGQGKCAQKQPATFSKLTFEATGATNKDGQAGTRSTRHAHQTCGEVASGGKRLDTH